MKLFKIALAVVVAVLVWVFMTMACQAQFRTEATIYVTNVPTVGATIEINGDSRVFRTTNGPTAIMATNTVPNTRTNIFLNLSAYMPAAGVAVRYSDTNIVVTSATNIYLGVTFAPDWAYVTYSTSLVYGSSAIIQPYTVQSNALRQWQMSCLATSIAAYATSTVSEASGFLSNWINKTGSQTMSNKVLAASALTFGSKATNLATENLWINGTHVWTNRGIGVPELYWNDSGTMTGPLIRYNGDAINFPGSLEASNAVLRDVSVFSGVITAITNGFSVGLSLSNASIHAYLGQVGTVIATNITTTNSTTTGTNQAAVFQAVTAYYVASDYGQMKYDTGSDELILTNTFSNSGIGLSTVVTVNKPLLANDGATVTDYLRTEHVWATNSTLFGSNSINGSLSLQAGTDTSMAAGVNVLNAPSNAVVVLSGPAGSWSLDGIANGWAGRTHQIRNGSGQTMTVVNESGVAAAGNRILTADGFPFTVKAGEWCSMWYDSAVSRWRLQFVASTVGLWTTNTVSTAPTLDLGSFQIWCSNGLALWLSWNTNGTSQHKVLSQP